MGCRLGKKEKLIENAQKLLQKGQIDRAIKEYQDAVALDPGDQRVRQRFAELLSRANRLDEARAEFEVIGKNLAANGFYLKAIAVYKQIEKLFPDDVSIILTLASLNEKHGLTVQAMAEYKRAYDYYERFQNMAEAVKILEVMQKADPQNVNIRLKQAEVLHQLGKKDESLLVFSDLAGVLIERRDDAAFGRLTARIEQLFPAQADFTSGVLGNLITGGNPEAALHVLHGLLKANPRKERTWELVVRAYAQLGQQDKLKTACQHYLRFFPDALLPKEQLARCLLAEKAVEGLLAHLEAHEAAFRAAGAGAQLVELYSGLAELAPIDVRVLKGALRACTAAGEQEQAEAYSAKIVALSAVKTQAAQAPPVEAVEPAQSAEEAPVLEVDDESIDLQMLIEPEEPERVVVSDVAAAESSAPAVEPPPEEIDEVRIGSDLYEIEVELDLDIEPDLTPPEAPAAAITENWFDTVSDIFDTIGTAPGKVKFGSGMENGDAQSHYDLGQAFREMGLYDEAINEFRQASEAPERRVECLLQQGACLRDKGELALAENALQSLLNAPGLSLEESCAIKYELAATYEAGGRAADAARLFGEIEAANPAFRDVKARLQQASDGTDSGGFDFDEDDLLDFELK